MRAALAAGLVVAACGGAKPAVPARGPARAAVPRTSLPATGIAQPHRALKPRPPLPLSAILPPRDPPWPLSELPSVQPHLDLAMAHDACTDDWAKRHASDDDARAYVAAWCKLNGGDRGAIDDLGHLARTARDDVARAARLDVVNLLADQMGADDAVAQLDSLGLSTPDTLDLLAGTYAALDMRDDAEAIGARVLRASGYAGPALRCERLLAWGLLDDATISELRRIDGRAGACADRTRIALCLVDFGSLSGCKDTLMRDRDLLRRWDLAKEWENWRRTPSALLETARELDHVLPVQGAEELAVTALEDAVLASDCEDWLVLGVRDEAHTLLASNGHDAKFDDRLNALTQLTPATCRSFTGT